MAGIISFGAYVPLYRLSRQVLGQFWGKPTIPGQKAVANADEDSLTMAAEAAIDCLGGGDRRVVDGLYFATASPAYLEKQNASIIAAAADLRRDIATADFGHSLRGATTALHAALDAVGAGSRHNVLVVAADRRVAAPNSDYEVLYGDGAAALLVGDQDVAVEVEAASTTTSEFMDVWRRPEDRFHRTWEDRFVIAEGYVRTTSEAIARFLEREGRHLADFSKVVFNAPDQRSHNEVARALRVHDGRLQDPLVSAIGNTGTASAPMMLVATLEQAQPGDTVLWANYSDGCDVFAMRVTGHIKNLPRTRGLKGYLASQRQLASYSNYVRFRNLMEWEPERRPADISALTVIWREREQVLRCFGSQCRQCQQIQYPVQRVCAYCQAKDDYDLVRLADRRGKIFTFSMDERAMALDLPNVLAIVDFDDGGRYYTVITDRDPQSLDVGQAVELTFRKLHEGHGILNYTWKARPVRD